MAKKFKYGDLISSPRHPNCVYLVSAVSSGYEANRKVLLIKLGKLDKSVVACSLDKAAHWKTFEALEEFGFEKVGHIWPE